MLDKSSVDKELARRLCAAFVSYQMGVTVATQYKRMPEDVGDLWYFLAAEDVRFSVEIRDGSLDHYLPFRRPEVSSWAV